MAKSFDFVDFIYDQKIASKKKLSIPVYRENYFTTKKIELNTFITIEYFKIFFDEFCDFPNSRMTIELNKFYSLHLQKTNLFEKFKKGENIFIDSSYTQLLDNIHMKSIMNYVEILYDHENENSYFLTILTIN